MRHKRTFLWLLKFIGVLLFIGIIARIDAASLLREIAGANKRLLLASFAIIFLIYAFRTLRWRALVHAAGIRLSFKRHWETVNIGVFLASISPGKIGEIGRAAYLKAEGMHGGSALIIAVLDRVIDTVFVAFLAAVSVGMLFGLRWSLIAFACIAAVLAAVIVSHRRLQFLKTHIPRSALLPISCWTLCAWIAHFAWAILLARAVGIGTGIDVLIAVLTLSGILSLLPVAPSGLGTRDAALIVLLEPYGIEPERAVALAFLMFASLILSGFLGGWYFVKRR